MLSALDEVVAGASQIEGELATNMTRDAAYSFWRIGCRLERTDMLLRSLMVLVPALTGRGDLRYSDVRWTGIRECVGAYAMFRRRYHACTDLEGALRFLIAERGFPRGFVHLHASIETELDRLPRAAALRAVLGSCRVEPGSFDALSNEDFITMTSRLVATLAKFGELYSEPARDLVHRGQAPVFERGLRVHAVSSQPHALRSQCTFVPGGRPVAFRQRRREQPGGGSRKIGEATRGYEAELDASA
jgi:uncharacterized alpha-E superfamily protein